MQNYTAVLEFLDSHASEYYYIENHSFRSITTFGIGGIIPLCIFPKSTEGLVALLSFFNLCGYEYKVLGCASNILPPDEPYSKIVICTRQIKGAAFTGSVAIVKCGTTVNSLVNSMIRHGLCGIETLNGIPATVGGAVTMNASAFGTEISDCLDSILCYDADSNRIMTVKKKNLGFSYRKSALQVEHKTLLLAIFDFKRQDSELTKKAASEAVMKKTSTQPVSEKCAGSVFLRKEGYPSVSRLIDMSGLKGLCIGDAAVSEKHAGFIVNRGNATSCQVKTLIEILQKRILSQYGFTPECEIEFL